ncbi:hypothetical protein GJR96_06450 [Haloferax sp. MBLA0076]|uniref:Nudix hydrolase domain-containing protein n=1 Tax=Haloferax litoreum TaxID=2666140 RepID=A0A6A8GDZ9_9EURY|nr:MULTISPECIES: hypothetical protein [Haloferax]KAB1193101.1 hypothetical protein Hfx1148_06440 [Haloferax sp. CBA1148]MRX21594.1 hypothetical protein [Haloferax litoreum]
MGSLTDLARLRDRDDVTFHEESHVIEPTAFDSVCEGLTSHLVVGVVNDTGSVLLVDDGSHGWTLAAFSIDADDDWSVRAQNGVEQLTGSSVELNAPERVRRLDYCEAGTDRKRTVYNIVYRTTTVEGRPVAADPNVGGEPVRDISWFDAVPAGCEGVVADDIRLFVG